MRGQIHNMHGPTVYQGDLEGVLSDLVRLNDPSPHNTGGIYRLAVEVNGHKVELIPYRIDGEIPIALVRQLAHGTL
jgi:hypothetical protein